MGASENEGVADSGNENGASSSGHKMVDDPKPDTQITIWYLLESGIMNEYGQLMGEYSRLDHGLGLPDPEDDDEEADGVKCHFEFGPSHGKIVDQVSEFVDNAVCDGGMTPVDNAVVLSGLSQHETIVDLMQPSEFVDNALCEGGMDPVKEKSQNDSLDLVINRDTALICEKVTSLKDSSQNQSQMSNQISVFQTKRSYSDVTMRSQRKCNHPIKNNYWGGLRIFGATISTGVKSLAFQSESEHSMESSLSDETEESIPSKQVRTRKISDILDLNSGPAVKKCMHCETTETPQWRTGPMGRKTLCNACGVQYQHGRLFPDYRPSSSPTFNPSIHFNFPKKVQKMILGSKSKRGPNPTHKPKEVVEMKMSNTSERGPNATPKPKTVEEMRMTHTSVRGPNPTPEPKEIEETRMGYNGEVVQNLTSEPISVKEMILGNDNERDQSRANRAHQFQEIRENAIYMLQSDSREKKQNSDSNLIRKRKLRRKKVKKCLHCGTTETPQWREGPMGRLTVCNACGMQFRAGRLFPEYRPLNSPTYNPLLHTHLPKKVQKMRMINAEKCASSGNHEKPT